MYITLCLLHLTPEISASYCKRLLQDPFIEECLLSAQAFELTGTKTVSSGIVMKVPPLCCPFISWTISVIDILHNRLISPERGQKRIDAPCRFKSEDSDEGQPS